MPAEGGVFHQDDVAENLDEVPIFVKSGEEGLGMEVLRGERVVGKIETVGEFGGGKLADGGVVDEELVGAGGEILDL